MDDFFTNNQINIQQLPRLEQVVFEPIDHRYTKVLLFSYLIFFFFLYGGLITLFLTIGYHTPLLIASFVITAFFLFAIISINPIVRNKAYAFRQHDISYKRGWIFKKHTTISFNRIQHAEISRGVLDRLFKLASLHIYTAGGSGSDINIPGINPHRAAQLKAFILEKTAISDEEE